MPEPTPQTNDTQAFIDAFLADSSRLCEGVLSDEDLADALKTLQDKYIRPGNAATLEEPPVLELVLAKGNLVRKLWKGLDEQFTSQLTKLEDDEAGDLPELSRNDVIFELIQTTCRLTMAWVEATKVGSEDTVPKPVLSVLDKLHGSLFHVGIDAHLESHVCKVFELWWSKKLQGRNAFMVFLLPVLLKRTLEIQATKTDVKRVYAVRGTLEIIDFDDESSVPLKHHLLRCFLTPVYINSADGRKFLCELFKIGGDFVQEIHLTVRQQFGYASQTMMKHYAQIYFKAWRASGGEEGEAVREAIETCVVQDVIDWAVHCSDKKTTQNLRQLMAVGFHRNKSGRLQRLK